MPTRATPKASHEIPDIDLRPRLFVASSTRAKPLANALASKLKANVNVRCWFKIFDPSTRNIMPELLRECTESDFAAVFLTRDDMRTKYDKTAQVPRDNCIYELGLFTGALGVELKRSFVITSVSEDALPTDLVGVSLIQITEPSDLASSSCVESISEAADQISKAVQRLGPCYKRPLLNIIPVRHLMVMERPSSQGGTLIHSPLSEVVVNGRAPIDLSHDFARVVCENLISEVRYRYYFEVDFKLAGALVRRLASSLIDVPEPGRIDAAGWKRLRELNEEVVEKALDAMPGYLHIHFLNPAPTTEFRIHNARDADRAICYLNNSDGYKSPNSFVEWSRRSDAVAMADMLRTRRPTESFVFQCSDGFDLYAEANKKFLSELAKTTLEHFPAGHLRERAKKVCFGYHVD